MNKKTKKIIVWVCFILMALGFAAPIALYFIR